MIGDRMVIDEVANGWTVRLYRQGDEVMGSLPEKILVARTHNELLRVIVTERIKAKVNGT